MNWKVTDEVDYTKAPKCWVRVLGELDQIIEFCNLRGDDIDNVQSQIELLCQRSRSNDKREWFSYWVRLSDDLNEVHALNTMGNEDKLMFKIIRDE